ncbi:MAG: hypothetical protein IKU67_00495, partial [Firmicutes bacterium]|nr:hypothetical protein [Bacillota bacterium]
MKAKLQTPKKALCILLAVMLTISLIPVTAFGAAEPTPAARGQLDFTAAQAPTPDDDDNWTWNSNTNTLTLSGVYLSCSYGGNMIILPAGSTIVVADDTENEIVHTGGNNYIPTIFSSGDITIKGGTNGTGKLDIESCGWGILANDGAVTVKDLDTFAVRDYGAGQYIENISIEATGDITINNVANVSLTARENTLYTTNGNITIANVADFYAFNAYGTGNCTISAPEGTLNAENIDDFHVEAYNDNAIVTGGAITFVDIPEFIVKGSVSADNYRKTVTFTDVVGEIDTTDVSGSYGDTVEAIKASNIYVNSAEGKYYQMLGQGDNAVSADDFEVFKQRNNEIVATPPLGNSTTPQEPDDYNWLYFERIKIQEGPKPIESVSLTTTEEIPNAAIGPVSEFNANFAVPNDAKYEITSIDYFDNETGEPVTTFKSYTEYMMVIMVKPAAGYDIDIYTEYQDDFEVFPSESGDEWYFTYMIETGSALKTDGDKVVQSLESKVSYNKNANTVTIAAPPTGSKYLLITGPVGLNNYGSDKQLLDNYVNGLYYVDPEYPEYGPFPVYLASSVDVGPNSDDLYIVARGLASPDMLFLEAPLSQIGFSSRFITEETTVNLTGNTDVIIYEVKETNKLTLEGIATFYPAYGAYAFVAGQDIKINIAEGIIIGTNTDMKYSFDGGNTWTDCTEGQTAVDFIPEATLIIADKDSSETLYSVELPSRPAAPTPVEVSKVRGTWIEMVYKDGWEYSIDGGKTWETWTFYSLQEGIEYTILGRLEGSASTFPSATTSIIVKTTGEESSGGTTTIGSVGINVNNSLPANPKAGSTAAYEGAFTIANDANYTATVKIVDGEGNEVDTFVAGESYYVEVTLTAKDGYEFMSSLPTPIGFTDVTADTADKANTRTYKKSIGTVQVEQPKPPATLIEIEDVAINTNGSLPENPEVGSTEAYKDAFTVPSGANYNATVKVVDSEGNEVDTFVEGESYYVEVTLTAKDGYEFTDSLSTPEGFTDVTADTADKANTRTYKKSIGTVPAAQPEIPPTEGTLDVNTNVSEEAPIQDVTLGNDEKELLEGDIFTSDEKEAIANGEDSKVWLEVDEVDEESLEEGAKAKFEEAAKEAVGKASNIVYFEADLFKQVGNGNPEKVAEPGVEIEITFKIPSELLNDDENVERIYKILRLHDGKVEIIGGEFNAETGEFTFKTDKFSTYGIVWTDEDKTPTTPG